MRSLPVVTYHQVNNLPEDIMEQQFHAHMRFLAENGWRSIFLTEWVEGRVEPDDKTVAITFDDGYLDNWVYAWPVLKKYGLKATVFVCTEWPIDAQPARRNVEDVWAGRCDRSGLPADVSLWDANRACIPNKGKCPHAMNWEELRAMRNSGLVDIQSHTRYHACCYIADQILDFNRNQDEYFDLAWATGGDSRVGIPVYPRRSVVSARRYFDDPGLRDHLADHVKGPEFFTGRERKDWLGELTGVAEAYRKGHAMHDRWETAEQCRQRIAEELAESKRTIEQKLGKPCQIICWPWGQYDELSIELAKAVGFMGAVAFVPGVNLKGTEAGVWRIKRFAAPGDVEGLERALRLYASPLRSRLAGWKRQCNYIWDRGVARAKDGRLLGTIKRRIAAALGA
jgi:peptidoglycan/xylan/chitin deacetylase (PgdA/CDA1 family)